MLFSDAISQISQKRYKPESPVETREPKRFRSSVDNLEDFITQNAALFKQLFATLINTDQQTGLHFNITCFVKHYFMLLKSQ